MVSQIVVREPVLASPSCSVYLNTIEKSYWVQYEHREGRRLRAGHYVILAEVGPLTKLKVQFIVSEYDDGVKLPPNARLGTILEIIEEA